MDPNCWFLYQNRLKGPKNTMSDLSPNILESSSEEFIPETPPNRGKRDDFRTPLNWRKQRKESSDEEEEVVINFRKRFLL